MKKVLSMVLTLCVLLSMTPVSYAEAADTPKLRIVSTIFPPYDFVRQIAGEAVELTMLLPPGSESHSFEPTPQDIIKIQNCDVFLYVGGETDAWVDRILESMDTSNMTVLPLLGMVDAVPEEIVEGMEHDHDHSDEAVDPDNVQDRPLTDWEGAWTSIAPLLDSDALDGYLQSLADENETTLEETRAARAAAWQSDVADFTLEGDTLTVTDDAGTHSAQYAYAGYALIESDHGTSVWYQYEIKAPTEGMPARLLFNDHSTAPAEHHEEHEGEHEEEWAHTHLRYGDESFDALLARTDWSPFFVDASAAPQDVEALLTGHGHSHDEEAAELDEHVWTSPKNAKRIVSALTDTLSALDSTNEDTYRTNATAYLAELDALDAAFAATVAEGVRNTIVFGDRFPFRYLADAYGLTYYAAFAGCATETEASAATIAFLIDKTSEENIPVVFSIEFSNGKIADVISESTGAARLEMHSCHNLSKQDFDSGIGYLELMWRNVDKLKEALS